MSATFNCKLRNIEQYWRVIVVSMQILQEIDREYSWTPALGSM